MNTEKPNQYGVESSKPPAAPNDDGLRPLPQPGDPPAAVPSAAPGSVSYPMPASIPPSNEKSAPIELERADDEIPPSQRSVKELDVCPNCGGTMRGGDTLVCLRCGFDLKTMKVVQTKTGEVEVTPEGEDAATAVEALVKPGHGDMWLPGVMAAFAGLLLLIGYLAGAWGLFNFQAAEGTQAAAEITIGQRFDGLLKFIVLTGMWVACGLGALAFLAHLLALRFGDMKLAAMRMLGIVALMRLATFLNFEKTWLEWTIEAIVQAAIFLGLAIMLFKLKPRDAPTLGGAALILFMLLWLLANLVVWVTG